MSRYRSRVDVPDTYGYFVRNIIVGSGTPTTGPFLEAYDKRAMIDNPVRNFKKFRQQGKTIINPMMFTRTSRDTIGTGTMSSRDWHPSNGKTYSQFEGTGNTTLFFEPQVIYPPLAHDVASTVQRAQLQALASVDSTPLATGEDLAELRETLQFLRSPLKGILKEAKKRNITKFVDVPAATWLTYRFAFMPMVRSIHDILSEVQQPSQTPAEIRVAHGRVQSSDRMSGTPWIPNSLGGRHNFSFNRSIDVNVHAFIRYRLKTATYNWQWRYGLRGKDIPVTYWAVMPLSFMVDRVFDVSSMVKAVTNLADPNVQILGAGTTVKTTKVFNRTLTGSTVNSSAYPGREFSSTGCNVIDAEFNMTRQPYVPSIKHVVPKLTPKGLVSDFTKQADLAALLRMFSRKK